MGWSANAWFDDAWAPDAWFDAASPFATVSGTAVNGLTEAQIVIGGETIVITLTNDTWVAAGATFNAQRQNIIDGLDSAQSEATGWNAEVRDKEVVTAVDRTSDTVVTITLSAAASYDVTAGETITVTVPATALVISSSAVVASPTIGVTADAETARGGHFLPVGIKSGRRVKEKEALEEAETIVQSVVAEVLEDDVKPIQRVSRQRKTRIIETAAQRFVDERVFIGELSALERIAEQLARVELKKRRQLLSRPRTESLQAIESKDETRLIQVLQLLLMDDEDLGLLFGLMDL